MLPGTQGAGNVKAVQAACSTVNRMFAGTGGLSAGGDVLLIDDEEHVADGGGRVAGDQTFVEQLISLRKFPHMTSLDDDLRAMIGDEPHKHLRWAANQFQGTVVDSRWIPGSTIPV